MSNNDLPNGGITCICDECKKKFRLYSDSDTVKGKSTYLVICSCESGGIYDSYVKCPHCNYRHDLM